MEFIKFGLKDWNGFIYLRPEDVKRFLDDRDVPYSTMIILEDDSMYRVVEPVDAVHNMIKSAQSEPGSKVTDIEYTDSKEQEPVEPF